MCLCVHDFLSNSAHAMAGENAPQRHPENPVVFFDVTIGGHSVGRVKMELSDGLNKQPPQWICREEISLC